MATYAGYALVDEDWTPEQKRIVAGAEKWKVLERMVHTKTWQAALKEGDPFPGPQNPGGLSSPWRLQSCHCSRPYGSPLSATAEEIWINEGQWYVVEEIDGAENLPPT